MRKKLPINAKVEAAHNAAAINHRRAKRIREKASIAPKKSMLRVTNRRKKHARTTSARATALKKTSKKIASRKRIETAAIIAIPKAMVTATIIIARTAASAEVAVAMTLVSAACGL